MAAQFDARPWTPMPTLIRLLVFLIVIAGLGFAGIVALTVMVDPGEKDITIKIPTRDLTPASQAIDLNDLPAPVNVVHDSPSSAASGASSVAPAVTGASDEPSIDTTDSAASGPGVKTVDTGGD